MPSFFSKKTRSQQASSTGPAGESPSGSAVPLPPGPPPPLLPDNPYQPLHQQQQPLEEVADRTLEATRRPSEPFAAYQFHGHRPHSPHSPYPAGIDLRYGREEDHYQQQQQQQQQYRHPAHHNPSQSDRPTISIVTPSLQQQNQQNLDEPPNYQQSPDRARKSIDQQHSTAILHNTSTPDLLQDSGKLQKRKKGFFSRNQSAASSNPATKQSAKKEKSLGRSASIKHSFGRNSTNQASHSSSEYGQRVTTTSNSGFSLDHNQSRSTLDNTSQQYESEASLRPPTAETPASPNRPSHPHTPLENAQLSQRLGVDITDRSHPGWQHRRSESFESIPSQVSTTILFLHIC